MIWFTSDHHFGHKNIIKHCNRPFESVEEMDEAMIAEWNRVVDEGDTVYHLGDFSLSGDADQVAEWFCRLNGTVHLLAYPWHHDKRWLRKMTRGLNLPGFPDAPNLILEPPIVVLESPPIVLCHYPIEEWDRKHHSSWHLHGHSHGKARFVERRLDVGVDCWDFRPVSLEEILVMERTIEIHR